MASHSDGSRELEKQLAVVGFSQPRSQFGSACWRLSFGSSGLQLQLFLWLCFVDLELELSRLAAIWFEIRWISKLSEPVRDTRLVACLAGPSVRPSVCLLVLGAPKTVRLHRGLASNMAPR